MALPFQDRREAGKALAQDLNDLRGRDDVIVLGLPRGGIPVAYEVAMAVDAPLDAYIVRKLGVPWHEELAMGAIASDGVKILNEEIVKGEGVNEDAIEAVVARETSELRRRERLYRGTQPPPDVKDRTVVLVDDGLATGTTMRAAVQAVQQLGPRSVIVAVPVAAPSVVRSFEGMVNRIVASATPEHFYALGLWYQDFTQTTDQEVRDLLAKAAEREDVALPVRSAGANRSPGSPPLRDTIAQQATPLSGDAREYDRLLDDIGDARLVLIGEASHGTEEFYRERAVITQRLIEERGFHAVAAEADWPDAFRVNRYVRDVSDDRSAVESLNDFQRFPQWMWRNTVARDFIVWLRTHNDEQQNDRQRAGFYGLDLYSLSASIQAVIDYLDQTDPEAAARARARYACFDQFADDAQSYGYAASLGVAESCEDEVVNQLLEMQRQAADVAQRDGQRAEDAFFSAEQNARLVRNAETYYRSMFRGRVSSWNLRDSHMADTLDELLEYLTERHGEPAKIVVWAHNSHLGDARATQMGRAGEHNLGQLARERHGDDAYLIGQTTHHGTVAAASDWGDPAERRRVRPGLPDSIEKLFHDVEHDDFLLLLRSADERLNDRRLERAIGVIYRPESERVSHYFEARLQDQFDAVLHFDETAALEPLEPTEEWARGEAPETFPFAGEPIPGGRRSV
ncbi:MAG TPA: erythromycin esterase family protein [Thermomicrobiales bacterium]|nr:erythromycin esterase family protein [Thermomicrobiales bacterium]